MEDVGSIEDDLEELSSLRRQRIDLLNEKKYRSIGGNLINPESPPIGQGPTMPFQMQQRELMMPVK